VRIAMPQGLSPIAIGDHPSGGFYRLTSEAAAKCVHRGLLRTFPGPPFANPSLTLQGGTKGFPSATKEFPSRG